SPVCASTWPVSWGATTPPAPWSAWASCRCAAPARSTGWVPPRSPGSCSPLRTRAPSVCADRRTAAARLPWTPSIAVRSPRDQARSSMATFADWVEGARIRTLPAAAAPVLVGTGAAYALGSGSVPRALLAAGVALALQVGVNFANDYSDGVRGTDDVRTGPPRLTGSGAARPGTVKLAAVASFAVAAVLGLVLCAVTGLWWLL